VSYLPGHFCWIERGARYMGDNERTRRLRDAESRLLELRRYL
jgi:hypothetical protein